MEIIEDMLVGDIECEDDVYKVADLLRSAEALRLGHPFLNILKCSIIENEFLRVDVESIVSNGDIRYKHLIPCLLSHSFLSFDIDVGQTTTNKVSKVLDTINSIALVNSSMLHKVIGLYAYFDTLHIVFDANTVTEKDMQVASDIVARNGIKNVVVSPFFINDSDTTSYGTIALLHDGIQKSMERIYG